MNEVRDLIIGIDFGKKYSQLCYYDRKTEEPTSVPVKVGSGDVEIPTCLCLRAEQGDYCIGLEAEYFAKEKDGILLENLYEVSMKQEKVVFANEEKETFELLAVFLKGILKFLGVMDVVKNTKSLVITMKDLTPVQVLNWKKACEKAGFSPEQYFLMNYEESFYNYVFTQKKEIWNRNIAWYSFQENEVTYRSFEMDAEKRPVEIRLTDPVTVTLPVEAKERDAAFVSFIRQTTGGELLSSMHLNGTGFSQEWAQESIKLLCYQRRKVFYGNNLFARGACGAGMERKEKKNLKIYRFMSGSLVLNDVGMELRVMGAPAYYPFIEAGKNWYECHAQCELILDRTEELLFLITNENGEKKRVAMELPGLPKRPNKTTRLSVSLEYVSVDECLITVKDLGFGDLYPGTMKVWRERTRWQGGNAE